MSKMIITKVHNVAEIIMGQSPPSSTYNKTGDGLPFLQGNKDFGKFYPNPTTYCNVPIRLSKGGDILVSVRAPVGAVNLSPKECCIGRGLAALRPKEKVLTKYLFYFFKKIKPWLSMQGSGSTFTAINKDILQNLDIPICDIDQQKKIIFQLEKYFEAIEIVDEKIEHSKIEITQLSKSVLAKAFRGEL